MATNPTTTITTFVETDTIDLSFPSMEALQHLLQVKLTPTNYLLWKNQLKPLINCFKLNVFIHLTIKPPLPTFIDNELVTQIRRVQLGIEKTNFSRVRFYHRCLSNLNIIGFQKSGSRVGCFLIDIRCSNESSVGSTSHSTTKYKKEWFTCHNLSSTN